MKLIILLFVLSTLNATIALTDWLPHVPVADFFLIVSSIYGVYVGICVWRKHARQKKEAG